MKKLAVCVGINDYPGANNDLHGCVNDANNWAELLTGQGYEVVSLLDSNATKVNVLTALRVAIARLKFSDRLVFTYSGHGSWVPDANGDEADGRDEVICLYDFPTGGLLSDDEMYTLFQLRKWGSRVTIFSDSCFSGTLARFANLSQRGTPRFLPPAEFLPEDQLRAARRVETVQAKDQPRSGTVLISGCSEDEYSYDADVDGQPQGAFSAYAIKTFKQGISMSSWYKAIRTQLPSSEYPQTPLLTARPWQRYWAL